MLSQLSLLLFLAGASAATPGWRLTGQPANASEAEVRDALARDAAGGVDALLALAARSPDPLACGLARFAAGLRLLDDRRPAEALRELSHADVQRLQLRDYALEATARAQEALGQQEAAARSYLGAAAELTSASVCTALPRAARLLGGATDDAVSALQQVVASCPRELADALLALGEAHLARGDGASAAAAFDRLDRELPGSPQAEQARAKLRPLAGRLPVRPPTEQARLLLARGAALMEARRPAEAIAALRSVPLPVLPEAEADEVRVLLAQALLAKGRSSQARDVLQKVKPSSPEAAHTAFLLARIRAKHTRTPEAFESVADRHRGSAWAEEALLALANHYQKDARDAHALPWWRRLLAEHPDGRYVERAAMRVGLADHRAGRHEAAAQLFERTARLRPPSSATPGLLYWAGRSRAALGQKDQARRLFQETLQRYKYTYHGLRASDALAAVGGPIAPRASLLAASEPVSQLPEPRATRARQLLLIERLDEAARELRLLPQSSVVQATLGWIEWRQGRFRPALIAIKRAFPEWNSEAGDRLPPDVWRIMFPLRYEERLRAAAVAESLDPALVAALILQESTFDASALSRAGARGLMQVMPATGRRLARAKGTRFRRAALHDPGTSLDFGTHYLRQMSDRFGGAVEKVLAAYNAGPHRVEAWTAERGERATEDFIEGIPFTETRNYVMLILANREHYRRIYGLDRGAPGPVTEGPRP